MIELPPGFILMSEALARLKKGMFGNLRRPEVVARIKQNGNRDISLDFGSQREVAGRALYAAACSGKLQVVVFATLSLESNGTVSGPFDLPVRALKSMIRTRGALPDHPIRPSLQLVRDGTLTAQIYSALLNGVLAIDQHQFQKWYVGERGKGKWPSQGRKQDEKSVGAPSKQTDKLQNAILTLVNGERWSAQSKVSALHRLLLEAGFDDVPSPDTLIRCVDALYAKHGDERLRRRKRRPRLPI